MSTHLVHDRDTLSGVDLLHDPAFNKGTAFNEAERDRLRLRAMYIWVYFGVVRSHPVPCLTLLVLLGALAIWTAPNRWGASIALHYLSRVYWPDPADPIPLPHGKGW